MARNLQSYSLFTLLSSTVCCEDTHIQNTKFEISWDEMQLFWSEGRSVQWHSSHGHFFWCWTRFHFIHSLYSHTEYPLLQPLIFIYLISFTFYSFFFEFHIILWLFFNYIYIFSYHVPPGHSVIDSLLWRDPEESRSQSFLQSLERLWNVFPFHRATLCMLLLGSVRQRLLYEPMCSLCSLQASLSTQQIGRMWKVQSQDVEICCTHMSSDPLNPLVTRLFNA